MTTGLVGTLRKFMQRWGIPKSLKRFGYINAADNCCGEWCAPPALREAGNFVLPFTFVTFNKETSIRFHVAVLWVYLKKHRVWLRLWAFICLDAFVVVHFRVTLSK